MFQKYFNSIQEQYLSDIESSEHTYRTFLQNFLTEYKEQYLSRNLVIKHEPTTQENIGRPDFKVTTQEQLTIGLIETKKIGEDLSKVLNSEQLERYKQLSDNIILTDYLHFYLVKKGNPVLDVSLFSQYNLENKKFQLEKSRIDELKKLLNSFFDSEPDTIYKVQDLALKLAEKAKLLREFCYIELESAQDDTNLIRGLFQAFKESLLPLLDTKYFADIYAQTITYSLFLASLNCNNPRKELNKKSAFDYLPESFYLIRELFHQLEMFPTEIVWAIDEIISILKVTDFASIRKEFSFNSTKSLYHTEDDEEAQDWRDPYIYFYEDFLRHYDKLLRELKGVYYTPEPIVSFIVNSIEAVLKEQLEIKDGLINSKLTLLDFATGTGTFLLQSFKQAIEQAEKLGDKHFVNKVLNDQIISNFYGFELLLAPYIIAHLKISEFFKDQGYSLDKGKRLNIFLTNTLTNNEPKPFPIMPNLSKEGKEANRIKNKDVLVILGNPPYSVFSENKNQWIDDLFDDYKPSNEKKWNPDDYMRFIRFAQWKMDNVEEGIVGIITNNSFLDGITHVNMRKQLLNTFDQLYILNLHGNSIKKEKDENVFDIRVGVSICIFIKSKKLKDNKGVFYFSTLENGFNKRIEKFKFLLSNNIFTIKWAKLVTEDNYSWFVIKRLIKDEKYLNKYLPLTKIFNLYSVGVGTKVDKISIDINKNKLERRIKTILNEKFRLKEIQNIYSLNERTTWEYNRALKAKYDTNKIVEYDYRPFDKRFVFYDNYFLSRSRKKVMDNFFQNNNIAIIAPRQMKVDGWRHIFVTNRISDESYLAGGRDLGAGVVFPLYIYLENNDVTNGNGFLLSEGLKRDNFTKEFRQYIKNKYQESYSPEQILSYIYAVLHSPAYREKYIDFLKIDFPKIPFTDDEELFVKLSNIGAELIEHHLLNVSYSENICQFKGERPNFKVEKISYEKTSVGGKVWINKERYFTPVPEDIWEFRIGGYQVLDKWLKERKINNIELLTEDALHFINIVNTIDYTIKTMNEIDLLTKEWI